MNSCYLHSPCETIPRSGGLPCTFFEKDGRFCKYLESYSLCTNKQAIKQAFNKEGTVPCFLYWECELDNECTFYKEKDGICIHRQSKHDTTCTSKEAINDSFMEATE